MAQFFKVYGTKPLSRRQLVWAALRGEIFSVDELAAARIETVAVDQAGALLNISTHDGWDVASALRGPDGTYPWQVLKQVFTERIRYLALGGEAGLPMVTHGYPVRGSRLSEGHAQSFIAAMEKINVPESAVVLQHFLVHVRNAANALGERGLAELASSYLPQSRAGHTTISAPGLTVEQIIDLAGGE